MILGGIGDRLAQYETEALVALIDLGPVPGAPAAKAFKREPSTDPTEYAFDLVVRRPDGAQVSISISYDALAALGIHSERQKEWLLSLAAEEAKLVLPPFPPDDEAAAG